MNRDSMWLNSPVTRAVSGDGYHIFDVFAAPRGLTPKDGTSGGGGCAAGSFPAAALAAGIAILRRRA